MKNKFHQHIDNLKSDIKNIEAIINPPLYRPFSTSQIKKINKHKNDDVEIKPKKYKPPIRKPKGYKLLKATTAVVLFFAVYLTGVEIHLMLTNQAQTIVDDFNDQNTIKDENGNQIETDENGQINPYPVTIEQQQAIINKVKNQLAQDAKNFGITDAISSIDSIDFVTINEKEVAGTFSNYLYSIKFTTATNTQYEAEFWADSMFQLSQEDQSLVDKLNEFLDYLLDPDKCALYNISTMSNEEQQIQNILSSKGNQADYVGQAIWAMANSGDIIYKIPVYLSDGTVDVWTADIANSLKIDSLGITPEEALIGQFTNGEIYFEKTAQSQNSVQEIEDICNEFQTNISNETTKIANKATKIAPPALLQDEERQK